MYQDKQEKPWQNYQESSQGIVELREMVELPKMARWPLKPTCSPMEDSDQDTEGTYAANWPQGQSEKRED